MGTASSPAGRGMSGPDLVLSLFPGIGLLDMAFEQEGFCVVRGPDLLWGGDIHRFHPPAGVFGGVIGGPPCQTFSALARLNRSQGRIPKFGNLIPEFVRCVAEAGPGWFLMENVADAPTPEVEGFIVHRQLLNNRWLYQEQNRLRAFSFGTQDGRRFNIETVALETPLWMASVTGGDWGPGTRWKMRRGMPTVTGNVGGGRHRKPRFPGTVTGSDGGKSVRMMRYSLEEACALQGLPARFLEHMPFRRDAALQMIANGVPLAMGRAVARAVRKALDRPDVG